MNFPVEIPIIIDSREPPQIQKLLSKQCPVEVKVLDDGDYKMESPNYPMAFLFSRKTIQDMIQSLNSGHWSDECARLIENYQLSSILIVEGNVTDERIKKTLWSLQYAIPIVFTDNIEQTVICLLHYRKKIMAREMGLVNRRPVLVGEVNPVIAFYSQIPTVGVEKARRIYTAYPKPYDLIVAINDTYKYDDKRWSTKKVWQDTKWSGMINGIGPDTAERIEAFILDGEVVE